MTIELALIKPLVKVLHNLMGSWMASITMLFFAFFGEGVLGLFSDAESVVKAISILVTAALAVLTFILSRKEKAATLKKIETEHNNARRDQLKEDIEWLRNQGWITEDSTDEEVQAALDRFSRFN